MSGKLTRRSVLGALAAATVPLRTEGQSRSAPGVPVTQPIPPVGLTTYQFESSIWIRLSGRPFTCYRVSPQAKYPYFYPLAGPITGLPMTEEAGDPFPHHRSLFLGCDRVNNGNYWQEGLDTGQIVSRGPRIETQSPGRIVLMDDCEWRRPRAPVILLDRRRWTIQAPVSGVQTIDADIELSAQVDIRIQKTNHSLFSLRAARGLTPVGGGMLRNSAGQSGEKETFGVPAAWCGFAGERLGRTESIVLMDHPRNPWSPCRWFTRNYGFASPTPFNWIEEDWTLAAGQSVRLRYRVAMLGGGLDPAAIEPLYQEFAV